MATVGGSPHSVAFGVADGVGGWQDQGVDPSDFSHGLCGFMAGTAHLHGAEGEETEGKGAIRPRDLMQTAYNAVMGNPRIVAGGCTASLGVLDGQGELEVAKYVPHLHSSTKSNPPIDNSHPNSLGDSGLLIISPGKITFRSPPQTHAFNTPYQMSKLPAKLQAQHAIFGSTHFSETPQDADVTTHKVSHGDIVLFATDGVWDNLSTQDTLRIITKVMEENGYWFRSEGAETRVNETMVKEIPGQVTGKAQESYLPGLLAAAVMREAKVAGLDRRRQGPFAKEVKRVYPSEPWEGGKPDDIAVVVAVAVENGHLAENGPVRAKL